MFKKLFLSIIVCFVCFVFVLPAFSATRPEYQLINLNGNINIGGFRMDYIEDYNAGVPEWETLTNYGGGSSTRLGYWYADRYHPMEVIATAQPTLNHALGHWSVLTTYTASGEFFEEFDSTENPMSIRYTKNMHVAIEIHWIWLLMTIDDISVTEDGIAIFTISLNGSVLDPLTVDFTTQDGTAIANQDYGPVNGTLTFLPGERVKTVEVSLIDDGLFEPTENFTINLSNLSNGHFDKSLGVATIIDNDEEIYHSVVISSPGQNNGGYTDQDGTQSILDDTDITITAIPDTNYEFSGWVGVPTGQENDNPITLTVTSDMTITAMFGTVPVNIETDINPFFLYVDKEQDKMTIQSKQAIDIPSLGETQEIEVTVIFKGQGINGGDLIMKGVFDADVNGQIIQHK